MCMTPNITLHFIHQHTTISDIYNKIQVILKCFDENFVKISVTVNTEAIKSLH